MAQKDNYIDLTIESDDEAKARRQETIRSHNNPTSSLRAEYSSQSHRTGLPSSMLSSSQLYGSQRQQPFSLQYLSLTRRSNDPFSMYRRSTDYLSNIEPGKSYGLSQRNTTTTATGSARPQRKTCVNCLEVNTTCDGERPCSACVEPGLTCYYPGEKPSAQRSTSSTRPTFAEPHSVPPSRDAQDPSVSTGSPGAALPISLQPTLGSLHGHPSFSSSSKIHSSVSKPNRFDVPAQQEPFVDSDDSEDDDVPLAIAELEEVKRLLRKHEARMRDHRAYLLQPLLNQANLDAAKFPEPDRPNGLVNPFISLVSKSKPTVSASSSKPNVLQIQTKSHRIGAPKKWTQLSVKLNVVDSDPTILPKYKSIGRLGTSLLAPNIRTLKYWPYFPDEENLDPSEAKKNEELEERYQHDDNHLLAQRKCAELVDMWEPWVKDFVSKLRIEFRDILYWFIHTAERTMCDTCERDILADAFTDISRLLPEPAERSLTLARLSTIALKEVAKISMWHFVLAAPSVKDLMAQMDPVKTSVASLCSVCFLHNCLSHGAYREPEESGGAVIMGGNVEINDEEPTHNIRLVAGVPNRDYQNDHQCGLYCVGAELRLKDLLGWRKDGTFGGAHNVAVSVPRLTHKNDTICGEGCFWQVEKRTRFGTVFHTKDHQPALSEASKKLFKQLLRIYSDNQRAPCMLARDVEGLKCIDAFYYMLAEFQRVSHNSLLSAAAAQQIMRKASRIPAGLETTLSADLDERPPFVPCSHSGPCLNNQECTCFQNKVHCEWFCGCDKSCDRRFPGCKCAITQKTCFNDKSCECWKHNRECDPWLCGTCGVLEVLDPQNKYNEEIPRGRCKNNRIQLDLPARTVKAPSEVQGWGLYAGVDLEEHAFIGEYKGETVGNQESDRRGAVYANIGQEYLFVMNRDQQIDGSNFGNKTRFINNSQRDDYINVFAKKLLCNGIQRVMLYAKKPIKAGEELLYNYNYPISVTKKFWERGEGPTNVPGAVVAKPSITWTQPRVNGRFAKVASKQDGEQSSEDRFAASRYDGIEDESTTRRDAKRKRAEVDLAVEAPVAAGTTLETRFVLPDDSNDSDFESVDPSESSGSVEAEGDSDPDEASAMNRKRRVVHPNDRRRGGLAQVKAWETRRKRTAKGK